MLGEYPSASQFVQSMHKESRRAMRECGDNPLRRTGLQGNVYHAEARKERKSEQNMLGWAPQPTATHMHMMHTHAHDAHTRTLAQDPRCGGQSHRSRPFKKVPLYHHDLLFFQRGCVPAPISRPSEEKTLVDTMTGRGRTRRHGSTGSNPFSLSASKLIRLGMMVVLMSSALYLFCTHTLVSREPSNGPSGDGSLRFNPLNPNIGEAIHRPGDPNLHYDSQVAYEEDPRNPGGVDGVRWKELKAGWTM